MTPLRYAVRSLSRARAFSIASVLTIALSIGAGCAVFSLVSAVLLRPLPYPNSDRLVGMWHHIALGRLNIGKQAPGTYALYEESAKSFDAMGIYVSLAATLTYESADRTPERVRLGYVTPSIFGVLGAKPLFGRLLIDGDAAKGASPVVVISERLWRSRFDSDPHVLGRTIGVDGTQRRIVGVMPASFAFPEANTPLWAVVDWAMNPTNVGGFGFDGIGRLRRGVSIIAAQRELQQILTRLPERFPEIRPGISTAGAMRQAGIAPLLHPLRDDVVGGFDHVLWLVAATVALLVLVAFSNMASLLLVRVESRQRELAVRSALGASTLAVWRTVIAECGLVAMVGGAVGVGLAAVALELLVRAAPVGIPRLNEVHPDASMFGAALGLMLAFLLIGGAIAMLRVRPSDSLRTLREAGRTGSAGKTAQRMRAIFVAVEVALSLVLLAGSCVLARSVARLRGVQPGFDPSNVFTFWTFLPDARYRTPADVARFYREAIDRAQRIPGVISAAATAKLPLEVEGFPYQVLIWADDGSPPAKLPPTFQTTSTTTGYFATMRIPLIAGRSYDDANVRRGALEAVASRGFVEHFWHDPTGRTGVGKRLRPSADGPWFTIVGVVGDVRDSTLTLPAVPEVYFPEEPNGDTTGTAFTTGRDMALVVRTRGPTPGLGSALRRELHALDPNLPFYRPATMEQVVSDARARMTFVLLLLAVGTAATLLLGIVGLYGVIAYIVSLRTREISIRIALGLDPGAAARMILEQGAVIVAIGAAVGLGAFTVFSHLLASLTFEVSTVDVTSLAAALLGVVGFAMLATWIPARRAARINPVEALKAE